MLDSVHFSKGCNCRPPSLPPCVIRKNKYFLQLLIFVFILWMQSHSHSVWQVSSAMLMCVAC